MDETVLLAILVKYVEERFESESFRSRIRGPRGIPGEDGKDGKSFSIEEHGPIIKQWVNEASLKFSDLTEDQIETLRGPKGKDGKDGKSFLFEENRSEISNLIYSYFSEIKNDLKLKFEDLSFEDKLELKGPRGQRGKPGKDFDFEEHRAYFETLKLNFKDLTEEEKQSLTLTFDKLTEDQRGSLKLKFSDLSFEEKMEIRGPRGQRGKQGPQGDRGEPGPQGVKGDTGERGPRGVRGAVGIQGLKGDRGLPGIDGKDGRNGKNAPVIIDISLKEDGRKFYFVFTMSDGTRFETEALDLPKHYSFYSVAMSGGGGGGTGGSSNFEYLFGPGAPLNTLGVDGNIFQDTVTGDQYKKIAGSWVLQSNIKGPQGIDGLTAYDIAVANGFVGNESQWLASLVGPPGPSGGGSSQILENIPCSSTVFVGSIVRLTQDNAVETYMSEWPSLVEITQINYTQYDTVAVNAIATGYQSANAIGVVMSKPTPTTCNIITAGPTPELFIGLDVQKEYFLSSSNEGRLVASFNAPNTPGHVYLKIGKPISSKKLNIDIGERIVRV